MSGEAARADADVATARIDALFAPFEHPKLRLRNRLVMAPMTRYRCPERYPTDAVAAYYQRRAEGGVGLIISEGAFIDHPAASNDERVPNGYGEAAATGWRHVLRAVHAAGARMFLQLWHAGSFRELGMGPDPDVPGLSPSGELTRPDGRVAPKAMNKKDIEDVVDAFARAAADAQRMGFDGVEVHGAHGYLVDEFLWGRSNRRSDRYGGDIARRARFAADIIAAIRDSVGEDYPLSLRVSQFKQQDYDARLAEEPAQLEAMLAPLVDAGVDLFHASERYHWKPAFAGSTLNWAGWIKRLSGRPAITVGSVGLDSSSFRQAGIAGIEPVLERLEREECDLVALGRALLADPAWANKTRAGARVEAFSDRHIREYR